MLKVPGLYRYTTLDWDFDFVTYLEELPEGYQYVLIEGRKMYSDGIKCNGYIDMYSDLVLSAILLTELYPTQSLLQDYPEAFV